jgi:MFS family permease
MGRRALAVIQLGIFLNMLGYGAVLPFEVIYLHEDRGLALEVAGLVVGTITGLAVLAAPVAGTAIDRFGARGTAAAASVALGVGYGALAYVHTPAQAFAAAAVAGAGNGGLIPSQSALIASLAPPGTLHRAVAISRVAANVGAGAGGALGGLVAAHGLAALFVANGATSVLYALVLLAAVPNLKGSDPFRFAANVKGPGPLRFGYRAVLRDGAFVRLAAINVAAVGVGWGVFTWVVPPYARGELGVGPGVLGTLLLVNAATVVVLQIPVARLAEGRRRAAAIALGAVLFSGGCLAVLVGGRVGLFAAAVVVGIGECLHTTAFTPLVADLAPAALRGRYMAVSGLTFWLGLAVAPTLGTALLAMSPPAALFVPAGVAAVAAASALALERRLPLAVRVTGSRTGSRGARAGPRRGPRRCGSR